MVANAIYLAFIGFVSFTQISPTSEKVQKPFGLADSEFINHFNCHMDEEFIWIYQGAEDDDYLSEIAVLLTILEHEVSLGHGETMVSFRFHFDGDVERQKTFGCIALFVWKKYGSVNKVLHPPVPDPEQDCSEGDQTEGQHDGDDHMTEPYPYDGETDDEPMSDAAEQMAEVNLDKLIRMEE